MLSRLATVIVVVLVPLHASGAVTFYLSPGNDPNGDLVFQGALSDLFTEITFESMSGNVDTITTPPIIVDVNAIDADGGMVSPTVPLINLGYWGAMSGNMLWNRSISPFFEFTFSIPVQGVGMWVFDDTMGAQQQYVFHVTEADGSFYVSPALDSGNGYSWAVEGFAGVTSSTGIVRFVIEQQDLLTGAPVSWEFEMDNLQIGHAVPPVIHGDLNCDGSVNFKDINPFVAVLTDPSAWQENHPGCPLLNGDTNLDGSVNFKDINPFVALLSGGLGPRP